MHWYQWAVMAVSGMVILLFLVSAAMAVNDSNEWE